MKVEVTHLRADGTEAFALVQWNHWILIIVKLVLNFGIIFYIGVLTFSLSN